jgi:hypothetical protein
MYKALIAATPGAAPDPAIADALGETPDEAARVEGAMAARQSVFQSQHRLPR